MIVPGQEWLPSAAYSRERGIWRIWGEESIVDDEIDPTDPAGEAVCWIGLLCPECGAMPEGEGARDPRVPCWRCGAVRPTDPGDA